MRSTDNAASPSVEDIYPLTPTQLGMLFHTLESPEGSLYIEQRVTEVEGALDREAFERAWDLVISRHSALRTSLVWRRVQRPVQAVKERVQVPLVVLDWSDRSPDRQEADLAALLEADRNRGFMLNAAPLMRLHLIRMEPTRNIVVWTNHHAVLDGWSRAIVLGEFALAYGALVEGQEPDLGAAAPQFGDFVRWGLARDRTRGERFWRTYLEGMELPTRLAVPRPAEGAPRLRIAARATFDATRNRSLAGRLRREGVTLSTAVQAAWGDVLCAYAGRESVVFGTVTSGRSPDLPGSERIVGAMLATIPTRVARLARGPEAGSRLAAFQRELAGLRDFETCSLVEIARWVGLPAGAALFESILVFENYPVGQQLGGDVALRSIGMDGRINYPLALVVVPGDSLELELWYDEGFVEAFVADDMLHALIGNLSDLFEEPKASVVGTTRPGPPGELVRTLASDLSRHAAERPSAIAVCDEHGGFDFRDLDESAGRLARVLVERSAGLERRIGVFCRRSRWTVAAMLGVWRAGATYVPLDPEQPLERLRSMCEQAALTEVVVEPDEVDELEALGIPVLRFPRSGGVLREAVEVAASSPAYLVFTSGSTGRPKGVLVAASAVRTVCEDAAGRFGLVASDRVQLYESFGFDVSILRIGSTLVAGGSLWIVPESERLSPALLRKRLIEQRITFADFPPSLWSRLDPEGLDLIRAGSTGGEIVRYEDVEHWVERIRLFNVYGPTEATIAVALSRILPTDAQEHRLSVGDGLAHCELEIVDAGGRPVPRGVVGELVIRGESVALGYVAGDDAATGAFETTPAGLRSYRTGDRARRRADGGLEIWGRNDRQIQLRGMRIELDEVENVVRELDGVRDVLVLVSDGALIAHVELQEGEATSGPALRAEARLRLPRAMTPGRFVVYENLPRNANGKVDTRALAEHHFGESDVKDDAAVGETEEALARIWSELLDVDHVGRGSDFFELGGHSLLAIDLVSMIELRLGIEPPVELVFHYPVLREFAAQLGGTRSFVDDAEGGLRLPQELLKPETRTRVPTFPPRGILLTGATGFLGAHLGAALLEDEECHLFALVRADDVDGGRVRVRENLRRYGLWDDAFEGRFSVLLGDMERPWLGLDAREVDRAMGVLDAVVHNAAITNLLAPVSAIRQANVGGTIEAMKIASLGTGATYHHISTTSVFGAFGEPRVVRERDTIRSAVRFPSPYARTKWEAELLVSEAATRGLPASIHRAGQLVGASGDGDVESFLYVMLAVCIEIGAVPEVDLLLDLTPVSYVARSIAALVRSAGSLGRTFHHVNPEPVRLGAIARALRDRGVHVRVLPLDVWRGRAESLASRSDDTRLTGLLRYSRAWADAGAAVQPRVECSATRAVLDELGVPAPSSGADLALELVFARRDTDQTGRGQRASSPSGGGGIE